MRRERLLRRLAQTTHVPLTLLVAPAGYGKTTLLDALARAGSASCRVAHRRRVRRRPRSARSPRSRTRSTMSRPPRSSSSPTRSSSARSRSRSCSTTSTICARRRRTRRGHGDRRCDPLRLTGRRSPAAGSPTSRSVACARTAGCSTSAARDLVMTRREAATMLSLVGLDLEPDDTLRAARAHRGLAGRALSRCAVAGRPTRIVHRAVARFGGDDRLLADYVRDELLDRLDAEQVAFLEQTSVLDELSGPVCDAVLHRHGSGTVLRDMSRSNLLVVPLDDADGAYRYHPLLGDMLQAELHRARPTVAKPSCTGARATGTRAPATPIVRSTTRSTPATSTRAGELLWATAARVFDGRGAEVRRRLERFTPEQHRHPSVARAHGRRPASRRRRAATSSSTGPRPPSCALNGSECPRRSSAGVAADARRRRAPRHRPDGVATPSERYRRSPEASPWRSFCCLLRGVGEHLRRRRSRGRTRLEEGARRGAISAPSVQALCLAQLGAARARGRRLGAGPAARRTRSRAGRAPRPRAPSYRRARLRGVGARRARTASASRTLRPTAATPSRSADLARRLRSRGTTPRSASVLARTALRLGDVTGTRTLLGEASSDAVARRRAPWSCAAGSTSSVGPGRGVHR